MVLLRLRFEVLGKPYLLLDHSDTRQYAPSGPLACSSHTTFAMHGPLTVDLMTICTPRMNTSSSHKQGDLEEIDRRGRHIASRTRIAFYKN